MTGVHCFTSASFSYLDRARVLANSVRRHHPDWTLWLCLSDTEPDGFAFDIGQEPFDEVLRVGELGIPESEQWIFCHDVVELCTAVKGAMLRFLLNRGAERVVYLDPDIALFAPIDPVLELLASNSIVLTPHLVEPEEERAAILDNEIGSLKHGTFNLGFLAVRNDAEGWRFAEWWRSRLLDFCYDDIPAGLFTDQRWCDLIPSFFAGTAILRDPGYNVASWNLSRRPLTIDAEGTIRAGSHLLRFFHFTKVTSVGEQMLERYSGDSLVVFELLRWYLRQLRASAPVNLPPNWWAFARYDDGAPIPKAHRIAYRQHPELRQRFPRPFSSGPSSLPAYFAQPNPHLA